MARMKPQPIEECTATLDALPKKYAALAALGIATGGRIAELLALTRRDLIDIDRGELVEELKILKSKSAPRRTSLASRISSLERTISEAIAPRNYAGQRLDTPPPPPKQKPRQYRRFIIPDGLKTYIIEHLNDEARRGYIRPEDYVFRGRIPGKPMQPQAARHFFNKHLGEFSGTHWLRKTYANFMYQIFSEQYGGDTYRAAREVQRLLGHRSIETTARYLCLDTARSADIIQSAFNRVFPPVKK